MPGTGMAALRTLGASASIGRLWSTLLTSRMNSALEPTTVSAPRPATIAAAAIRYDVWLGSLVVPLSGFRPQAFLEKMPF